MADPEIITKARDVLAKWREDLDGDALSSLLDADVDPDTGYTDYAKPEIGARLIFGTAGNLDLLDAIDTVLGVYASYSKVMHRVPTYIKSIAAAIVAADERMTSA
jgi:hypothetical protein